MLLCIGTSAGDKMCFDYQDISEELIVFLTERPEHMRILEMKCHPARIKLQTDRLILSVLNH